MSPPSTRTKVEELLLRHGYRRRRGASQQSQLIDLVFHELDSAWAMEVVRGVENVAREEGLSLVLSESAGRLTPGQTWVDGVLARRPAGVILVLSDLDAGQRAQLTSRSIPFVVVDPAGDPGDDIPSVGAANWQGGLAATRHLTGLGHRRIGVIGGPARMMCSRARLDGYRAALETSGVPMDPALVREGEFNHEDGYTAALALLRLPEPPTAIFAGQRPPGARRLRGRARAGAADPGGPQRGRLRRPAAHPLDRPPADHGAPAAHRDGRDRGPPGPRPGPGQAARDHRGSIWRRAWWCAAARLRRCAEGSTVTPEVRTARLLLTPYTPGDEESFVALFQDVRVSRWMGDGPSPEAEDRALFGRVFTKVYARGLFDVWAVREGGRTVGHAEIKPTPESGGHEIVYALAPDVWGRGLGTEPAGALVAEGFGRLGLREVYATVAAENGASLALLGRIGFRHVRDVEEADGSTTRLLVRAREGTGTDTR